jgi:hypothetical protein
MYTLCVPRGALRFFDIYNIAYLEKNERQMQLKEPSDNTYY